MMDDVEKEFKHYRQDVVILTVVIILIVAIAVVVLSIVMASRTFKKMKQKVGERGAHEMVYANHVEGLGVVPNTLCEIYRFDDKVLIEARERKFEIKLENMEVAVVKSERELVEKSKSVVGRALIGTLLVPGLGTIVGGMSGIGTKKKKGKENNYLIFNYKSTSGEMKAVTFQINPLNFTQVHNFCDQINIAGGNLKPNVISVYKIRVHG